MDNDFVKNRKILLLNSNFFKKIGIILFLIDFYIENQKFTKVLWFGFSPDRNGNPVISLEKRDDRLKWIAGKWITERNDSLRFLNKLNDFLV